MTFHALLEFRRDKPARGIIVLGLWVLAPLLMCLALWAFLAPLSSASIAMGRIVLNSSRKTVQHLEGGLVEKLLVAEGDHVERGQPLLLVRDTSRQKQLETVADRLAEAFAVQARAKAELKPAADADFSAISSDLPLSPTRIDDIIALHRSFLRTKLETLATRIDLIRAEAAQTQEQVKGREAELASLNIQRAIAEDEFAAAVSLHRQGIATLVHKRDLERRRAELDGNIGASMAEIARLKGEILAADLQINDARAQATKQTLDELQANELQIQELQNTYAALSEQMARTSIVSPVAGRVMGLTVHTIGAVIAPGQALMDIVPEDDRLIVEARLNPNDIDLVASGTQARIVLTAYKSKHVPKLDGIVEHVSADVVADPVTGERYFLVRIRVDDGQIARLTENVHLYPGMPVEAFLINQSRTMADYILTPFRDATFRAFREE